MSSFLSSPNQSSFPTSFCSQVSLWLPQASLVQGLGKAASIHTPLCPASRRAQYQGPGSTQGLRFPGSVSRDVGDGPARQDLALAQISPRTDTVSVSQLPCPPALALPDTAPALGQQAGTQGIMLELYWV